MLALYISALDLYSGSLQFLTILTLIWVVLYAINVCSPRIRKKLEKSNITIYPFLIYAKTGKFNNLITSLGIRLSRITKIVSTLSIIIGILLMLIAIYFIHINIINYFTVRKEFSPVTPIVPGITIGPNLLPYFILSVTIAFLTHEIAHALTAISENVEIKSVGVAVVFAFLGAFVEPNEEQFNRSSPLSKLRIVSMGSLANIVVFLIAIGLVSLIFEQPNMIVVINTLEGYPAHGVLRSGDLILSINNTRIYNVSSLHRVLSMSKPGDLIVLKILRHGSPMYVKIRLAAAPNNKSRGFMGVQLSNYVRARFFRVEDVYYSMELFNYLYWIIIVNGSVAVINMLPMYITDGSKVIQAVAEKFLEKTIAQKIVNAISMYSLTVLIVNIILTYI